MPPSLFFDGFACLGILFLEGANFESYCFAELARGVFLRFAVLFCSVVFFEGFGITLWVG